MARAVGGPLTKEMPIKYSYRLHINLMSDLSLASPRTSVKGKQQVGPQHQANFAAS